MESKSKSRKDESNKNEMCSFQQFLAEDLAGGSILNSSVLKRPKKFGNSLKSSLTENIINQKDLRRRKSDEVLRNKGEEKVKFGTSSKVKRFFTKTFRTSNTRATIQLKFPENCNSKSNSNECSGSMIPSSLKEALSKPFTFSLFWNFLRSEYSEENLDFWQEVQTFRKSQKNLRKISNHIFKTFIQVNAPSQINISHEERKKIAEELQKPHFEMFNSAQNSIFKLMENDSFERFKSVIKNKSSI